MKFLMTNINMCSLSVVYGSLEGFSLHKRVTTFFPLDTQAADLVSLSGF
jgi:hypothetical protein